MLVVAADAKSSKEDAPTEQIASQETVVKKKPKVVVLGTGWAGMSFTKEINTDLYDVQVVSPRNHFVFTPLLPSVTNGTVEARSISEPIRRMFKAVSPSLPASCSISSVPYVDNLVMQASTAV